MGYCLSAIPQPHGKLSYRLLAIGYRLSAIGYGRRSPPAQAIPMRLPKRTPACTKRATVITCLAVCNAISMTHCYSAYRPAAL